MSTSLDSLRTRAVSGMRGYLDHEGAERTLHLKDTAEALLDARSSHFFTRDGKPDYLGRTHEYRAWVSSALEEANVPKAVRATLQSAVRHHVNPLLHERFGDQITELGLDPTDSVARNRRQRNLDARLVALFSGGGEVNDIADIQRIADSARLAFSRISGAPGASKVDRDLARKKFVTLSETAARVATRLK